MDTTEVKPVSQGRRPRRKLRSPNPEVRERLLEAAMDLIRTQGFQDLRVDEVARRAGLSVGTFYLYFEGKDELFTALVVRNTEMLRARRREAVASAGSGPDDLQRGLDSYLDFVEENARGFQYFRRAGSVETNVGDLMSWVFEQHSKDLRPALEQILDPEQHADEIDLLCQVMLAATQHLVGYWLENRDRYERDQIKRFIGELTASVIERLARRRSEQ